MYFVQERTVRASVGRAFARWSTLIARVLPTADIQHVGATAVPGSLTKGDLDINVRVATEMFKHADAVLAGLLSRNAGSTRTATFSAFEVEEESPSVGVQLTAIGSEDDFFVWQRERLRSDAAQRVRYHRLKRSFHGQSHAEYREAKARFWEDLLRARSWDRKGERGGVTTGSRPNPGG